MTSLKCYILLIIATASMVCSVPVPGGYGHDHTHFIIHVPHHVHTVHHTHVKKIHVPIVKTVLLKEPPIHHGWALGGWHGGYGGGGGWW